MNKVGKWYIVPVDMVIIIIPFVFPLEFTEYFSYFLVFMSAMLLLGVFMPTAREKAFKGMRGYTKQFAIYDILSDIAFIAVWVHFEFYFLSVLYFVGKGLIIYTYRVER